MVSVILASRRLAARRRTKRAALRAAFLACLALAAASCATTGRTPASARITPEDLLAGTALGVAAGKVAPVADEKDILGVTPEMRAFVDAHVDPNSADTLKLHQLVTAIMGTDTFGVKYDTTTRTAAETFRSRQGNCLSFSSMFVAMAREVGLKVQFEEVEIPPDWTLDKDTYVLNQHVNVRVDLGPAGVRVVDFNIADFKASYEMTEIPDTRAFAHYFNNIGVERMLAGDVASALACFRKAIADGDRKFSPAWCNLGTLYLRAGHPGHAEAAYLQALKEDADDLVAMSDLARLYDRMGERQRAAAYRKRVIHHRWLNPYYRYELARQAYTAKRYDAAISHLRYAVRERPKEDQFCSLMGLCYLGKGNSREARYWLAKAEQLAATDALKRRYSHKIDVLLGPGGQGQR